MMDFIDWVLHGLFILVIALLVFFGGFIIVSNLHFGESNKQEVYATVVDKEYNPPSTSTRITKFGSTTMVTPVTTPADYYVTCEYEGHRKTIDSEEIYNSTEIGDSIPLTLVTWYKKDGSIRKQFLTE